MSSAGAGREHVALPSVTVVVLTRDRRQELLRTLALLTGLAERPAVVVVDNGSADGSPAAVRSMFPDIRVLELHANLGAAGRNLGVVASRTPYVAFSDDDSWWAAGALDQAVAVLEDHPRLGLVAARILVGVDDRLDPTCTEMAESPLEHDPAGPGPAVLGFVACGTVVRRVAFLDVPGFHPCFGVGGEETLVALDLASRGWQLVYRDDVVAHHHPSAARDPERRTRIVARNDLLTAWLRLPLRSAWKVSIGAIRLAWRQPAVRRGLLDAARLLPSLWPDRRVVPRSVARAHRLLRHPASPPAERAVIGLGRR